MSKHSYKTFVAEFRQMFNRKYSYISHSLTDEQIEKWLVKQLPCDLNVLMDQFSDYILSQDLADEVQL